MGIKPAMEINKQETCYWFYNNTDIFHDCLNNMEKY